MNQQCPQCQAPLKPNARFCGKCGAKVDAPDPVGATQKATYAPPVPQAVERPQPQTPAQPQVIPAQPVTSLPPASKSKSGIGFAVTATFFVILFFGIAIFSVLSRKPTQQNPPPTLQSTSQPPSLPTVTVPLQPSPSVLSISHEQAEQVARSYLQDYQNYGSAFVEAKYPYHSDRRSCLPDHIRKWKITQLGQLDASPGYGYRVEGSADDIFDTKNPHFSERVPWHKWSHTLVHFYVGADSHINKPFEEFDNQPYQ